MLQHAFREPADDADEVFAVSLSTKILRCGEGFLFRQVDAGAAMLMRGDAPGPVLRCGCNRPDCTVRVDPHDSRTLVATEDECRGNWGWALSVPGMTCSFIVLSTGTHHELAG